MPVLRGAGSIAGSALLVRALPAAALLLMLSACAGGGGFGRQYEYDEQIYLSANGSATIEISASIPALVALHGLPLDTAPRARIDRDRVRAVVEEPGLEISRVSRVWRRDGRQFIQIRAEIADVRTLGKTKLFQWADATLTELPDGSREYRQRIGPAPGAMPAGASYGWNGNELVAFKLHLPSRINAHNVRDIDTNATGSVARGNILTWEQRLTDRLAGKPVDMHVAMESGSILYRTLSLFAASFAAAILLLVIIIWRIIRRGKARNRARA
ncbi:MAG: hypothetical protein M3Q55_00905 [Acidobacteriota bacterium]|nr:hypothetical protein [Acidobacteriota bacterium]